MSLFLFEDEPWALLLPWPDLSYSLLWYGGKPGCGRQGTRSPTPVLHLPHCQASFPALLAEAGLRNQPTGIEGAQDPLRALSKGEGPSQWLWEASKQLLLVSMGRM